MSFKTKNLVGCYLLPGMPHLLHPEKNENYRNLHQAMNHVADHIAESGAKRLLIHSTQWLSVLGLSFQGRSHLKGVHVDENWYNLPNLDFDIKVDTKFSEALCEKARSSGQQAKVVDYDHFPIDTGTIVANKLANKSQLPVSIFASHVYSDYDATLNTANELRQTIEEDSIPTAVVGVSLLTTNFHTKSIDLSEDMSLDPESDNACKKLLGAFEGSGLQGAHSIAQEIVKSTRTDMALKVLSFLDGISGGLSQPAAVHAYGSLYGAGAAVVSFKG